MHPASEKRLTFKLIKETSSMTAAVTGPSPEVLLEPVTDLSSHFLLFLPPLTPHPRLASPHPVVLPLGQLSWCLQPCPSVPAGEKWWEEAWSRYMEMSTSPSWAAPCNTWISRAWAWRWADWTTVHPEQPVFTALLHRLFVSESLPVVCHQHLSSPGSRWARSVFQKNHSMGHNRWDTS